MLVSGLGTRQRNRIRYLYLGDETIKGIGAYGAQEGLTGLDRKLLEGEKGVGSIANRNKAFIYRNSGREICDSRNSWSNFYT